MAAYNRAAPSRRRWSRQRHPRGELPYWLAWTATTASRCSARGRPGRLPAHDHLRPAGGHLGAIQSGRSDPDRGAAAGVLNEVVADSELRACCARYPHDAELVGAMNEAAGGLGTAASDGQETPASDRSWRLGLLPSRCSVCCCSCGSPSAHTRSRRRVPLQGRLPGGGLLVNEAECAWRLPHRQGEVEGARAGGNRTVANMEIDNEFAPIPRDTRAIRRQRSLLGETYVELSQGAPSRASCPT